MSGRDHSIHLTTSLLSHGGAPGKCKASVLDKDHPGTKVMKHLNFIATIDLTIPAQKTGAISLSSLPSQQLGNVVDPMEESMNGVHDPEHAIVIDSDSAQEV